MKINYNTLRQDTDAHLDHQKKSIEIGKHRYTSPQISYIVHNSYTTAVEEVSRLHLEKKITSAEHLEGAYKETQVKITQCYKIYQREQNLPLIKTVISPSIEQKIKKSIKSHYRDLISATHSYIIRFDLLSLCQLHQISIQKKNLELADQILQRILYVIEHDSELYDLEQVLCYARKIANRPLATSAFTEIIRKYGSNFTSKYICTMFPKYGKYLETLDMRKKKLGFISEDSLPFFFMHCPYIKHLFIGEVEKGEAPITNILFPRSLESLTIHNTKISAEEIYKALITSPKIETLDLMRTLREAQLFPLRIPARHRLQLLRLSFLMLDDISLQDVLKNTPFIKKIVLNCIRPLELANIIFPDSVRTIIIKNCLLVGRKSINRIAHQLGAQVFFLESGYCIHR